MGRGEALLFKTLVEILVAMKVRFPPRLRAIITGDRGRASACTLAPSSTTTAALSAVSSYHELKISDRR